MLPWQYKNRMFEYGRGKHPRLSMSLCMGCMQHMDDARFQSHQWCTGSFLLHLENIETLSNAFENLSDKKKIGWSEKDKTKDGHKKIYLYRMDSNRANYISNESKN